MIAFVVDIFHAKHRKKSGLRSFQNRFKESTYYMCSTYYILTLLFILRYLPELKQITVVAFQPAHLAQDSLLPKNQLRFFLICDLAKYSQK